LIFTLVFFSSSCSQVLVVKLSPILPQRTVSTSSVIGSLTIGRPSLLTFSVALVPPVFSFLLSLLQPQSTVPCIDSKVRYRDALFIGGDPPSLVKYEVAQ